MSIRKITQNEILKNGIKGLPTRPSTPSLYRGSTLSAEELKEAFDKLPTLIAERFNALLDCAGLYDAEHPADTLAALIATNMEESHSLRDFFEDVKNGNLALYLTAGEDGEPLADVLATLRDMIERNKRYAISLEGDGDILTDVSLDEDKITIRREARIEEILDEARAYTDAPTGNVTANCSTPVSGAAVFHAIEKFNKDQSDRIGNLENAAKDILYTYPVVKSTFSRLRTADHILANSALLKMGAAPMPKYNLFPEQTLFNFQSDDLSITWDDERKELVMNGTLRASQSPLHIVPFKLMFPYQYYSGAVFYRSGVADTESASISIVSDGGSPFEIPLLCDFEENHICVELEGTQFTSIELVTTEDTVFTDYRFNLLISREQPAVHYEPFCSQNRFHLPKKLTALGPNCYQSTDTLVGETFVSLKPDFFFEPGDYMFGIFAQSTSSSRIQVQFHKRDGTCSKFTCQQNEFRILAIALNEPLTEIRIYAAKSPEASVGHTVRVKNIYMDHVEFDAVTIKLPYAPHHHDEITFPKEFERFSPLFLGLGDENCNYFDFELGCFVESYRSLTLDGSLPFEAVEGAPGRFSAPFPVPEAIKTDKNVFRPSSLLSYATSVGNNESVCFTSDSVVVQSELFVGKEAEAVKYFFNLCPIDIVYKEQSEQKHFLTEDGKPYFDVPTIRTMPRCHLYFSNDEEQMIHTFSHIQYQIKQGTEATV